jgi:hypothetical protein
MVYSVVEEDQTTKTQTINAVRREIKNSSKLLPNFLIVLNEFILDKLVMMLSYLFYSIIFPILIAISLISYRSISLSGFHETMAWRSSGSTHRELIENLHRNGFITDERIKQAMLQVDRADFTDEETGAYNDRPQSSK